MCVCLIGQGRYSGEQENIELRYTNSFSTLNYTPKQYRVVFTYTLNVVIQVDTCMHTCISLIETHSDL